MRGKRFRARALMLLAAVLAGTLVVTAPRVAEAAADLGPVVIGSVDASGSSAPVLGAETLSCDVRAAYLIDVDALSVLASIKCTRNALLAANMAMNVGYIEGTVGFHGARVSNGAACSAGVSFGDSMRVSNTESGDFGGLLGSAPDCQVSEICLDWTNHNKFLDDVDGYGCAPFVMGPPGVASPDCEYGYPLSTHTEEVNNPSQTTHSTYHHIVTIQSTASVPVTWGAYFKIRGENGGIVLTDANADVTVAAGGTAELDASRYWDANRPEEIYGVEVWVKGQSIPGNDSVTNYKTAPTTYVPPVSSSTGYYGITDPAACRFWLGDSVLDIPGDYDTPFGPVEGPPPPSTDPPTVEDPNEETCDFSLINPTTWHCAWDFIGEIIRMVTGAFRSMLTSLFKPDPGSWDWEGFIDQAETRPPVSVAVQSSDIAAGIASGYQSSGDCGVLITMQGHDLECSAIRNVAGFSTLYALVQVGLVSLTLLGLYTMLAGSLRKG